MKKIAGLVAAGALLFASAGVAFAQVWVPPMPSSNVTVSNYQNSYQPTISVGVANSGLNGGFASTTGAAYAYSSAYSVGNQAYVGVNGCTSCSAGNLYVGNYQNSSQLTLSGAVANSGLNNSGYSITSPATTYSYAQSYGNWAQISVVH